MTKKTQPPRQIESISELHSSTQTRPKHPLVTVIDFADVINTESSLDQAVVYQFYCISLKKNFKGLLKYGQHYYDFDDGMMTFIAPGQVISVKDYTPSKLEGYMLAIHPSFLEKYPLASKIKSSGLFSYAYHEALYLSESEEQTISNLFKSIQAELASAIDAYTQDLIVSQIELLLSYCNRFYHRQFITQRVPHNDLVAQLDMLLESYFNQQGLNVPSLPSVQDIAAELNVSSNYLSDLLRAHTGQSTQQHIQNKLIQKSKDLLAQSSLSVSEIAYRMGFEYPQSFNKLFKNKTQQSPLEYRQSIN